ncbi:MAG: hypothetical protein ACRDPR_03730 [Nocardioidaceae bacterium]
MTVPAAGMAGGRAVRAVWRNELGGVTFKVGTAAGRRFREVGAGDQRRLPDKVGSLAARLCGGGRRLARLRHHAGARLRHG